MSIYLHPVYLAALSLMNLVSNIELRSLYPDRVVTAKDPTNTSSSRLNTLAGRSDGSLNSSRYLWLELAQDPLDQLRLVN
jgi:hypothetical protein